jgi:hypothetical protein
VCEASALPLGETKSGELTMSDCLEAELLPFFSGSSRVDLWKFDLETPGQMKAEIGTENAMPHAFLIDADLKVIAFDVNLNFLPNARIGWEGQPGTYYLMIGSYSGPGQYTVRAEPDSGSASQ